MSKAAYLVLGWRIDPEKGLVTVVENPKSSNPQLDVRRALALRSSLVDVKLSEGRDIELVKEEITRQYARVGVRDKEGRYIEPPLRNRVRAYTICGFVQTGKFHPVEKNRRLQRILFRAETTADPVGGVEKALRLGCTSISIGLDYEQPERNLRENYEGDLKEEESERRIEKHGGKSFQSDGLIPAYCIYEKKDSMLKNPKRVKLKNGLPAIEGNCISCGRQISKLGTLK